MVHRERQALAAGADRPREHLTAPGPYVPGPRAEVPRVRRVAQQDFTWEAGVDVTDVRQTKGLEFDEVILLETTAASYPDRPPARHALYVGATRAAHQLWCVASEAPSPIVTQVIEGAGGSPQEGVPKKET